MRILIIIDGLTGGGAERTAINLASGLLEMNHQISIFSLREERDYPIPKGINYRIIEDKCRKPWRKITEISRRARLLDHAISEEECNGKFDLIFSNLHKTDRIVVCSRILDKNKVWFCVHSMLSFSYLHHRRGFFRWIKYLKIRYTYKNRNVVAVSSAVLKDITSTMKIPLRHGVIIHNPFNVDVIRRQAKEPFEMQGQDYLIHVGRFHKNKRHDRLLRAYALSKIDAPLVIMGNVSKDRIAYLKGIAESLGILEKVLFRAFLPNPYPWINGARLLVLSSDCEGLGNVLIEAIICQTPVVSTRCLGGPTEILTGPLCRGLSDLNDEDLSKTLSDIYINPPSIDNAFASSYGINRICQQYLLLAMKYQ